MKFFIVLAATALLAIGIANTDAASSSVRTPVGNANVNTGSRPASKPASRPSSAPQPALDTKSMEVQMLCAVNKFRSKYGLQPLGLDQGLNRASLQHSQAQASRRQMEHRFPGGTTPTQRMDAVGNWMRTAENVAYGWPSVEVVMDQWIKSPGHNVNMRSDTTHFGAGMAKSSNGTPYWTQNFGQDRNKPKNIPKC
ncbi:CAP domain-containing protein [Syncephalis fuscata]|nr:CAP domain-containing protein [Syncephalis fuscata]